MSWISIWGYHVLTSLDSSLGQSCGQCFGCQHGDVSVLWWKRGSSVVGEGVVREFRECRKNEKDVGKKWESWKTKKTTTKQTHTFFIIFRQCLEKRKMNYREEPTRKPIRRGVDRKRMFLSMLRCSSACRWNFKVWRSWAPQRTEKHRKKWGRQTSKRVNSNICKKMKQKNPETFWKNNNYSYISGKVKEESKHTFYGDCDCLGRDGATKCEALLGQGTHGAPAWRSDDNGGVWYYKMLDFKWHQRSKYDAEGLRDRIFTYFCVQNLDEFGYILQISFIYCILLFLQIWSCSSCSSCSMDPQSLGLALKWNDILYHEIASECENHDIICIFFYIIYI